MRGSKRTTVTTAQMILAEHDRRRDKALGLITRVDDRTVDATAYALCLFLFVLGGALGYALCHFGHPATG